MALEDAIVALTEQVKINTATLEKVLAAGGAGSGDEPKTTRASKKAKDSAEDTKGTDAGETTDAPSDEELLAVRTKAAEWMKEFKDDESDPENEARGKALAEVMQKLGVAKLGEIKKKSDVDRLHKWLDKKVAEGRSTQKPGAKTAAPADDDL